MSVAIESLGVSVAGPVVRRHDRTEDRTTLVLSQGQARELYDALAPVLAFFDGEKPQAPSTLVNTDPEGAKGKNP